MDQRRGRNSNETWTNADAVLNSYHHWASYWQRQALDSLERAVNNSSPRFSGQPPESFNAGVSTSENRYSNMGRTAGEGQPFGILNNGMRDMNNATRTANASNIFNPMDNLDSHNLQNSRNVSHYYGHGHWQYSHPFQGGPFNNCQAYYGHQHNNYCGPHAVIVPHGNCYHPHPPYSSAIYSAPPPLGYASAYELALRQEMPTNGIPPQRYSKDDNFIPSPGFGSDRAENMKTQATQTRNSSKAKRPPTSRSRSRSLPHVQLGQKKVENYLPKRKSSAEIGNEVKLPKIRKIGPNLEDVAVNRGSIGNLLNNDPGKKSNLQDEITPAVVKFPEQGANDVTINNSIELLATIKEQPKTIPDVIETSNDKGENSQKTLEEIAVDNFFRGNNPQPTLRDENISSDLPEDAAALGNEEILDIEKENYQETSTEISANEAIANIFDQLEQVATDKDEYANSNKENYNQYSDENKNRNSSTQKYLAGNSTIHIDIECEEIAENEAANRKSSAGNKIPREESLISDNNFSKSGENDYLEIQEESVEQLAIPSGSPQLAPYDATMNMHIVDISDINPDIEQFMANLQIYSYKKEFMDFVESMTVPPEELLLTEADILAIGKEHSTEELMQDALEYIGQEKNRETV